MDVKIICLSLSYQKQTAMSGMTEAYLLARKEPVSTIEIGKEYRVVGFWNSGAKFIVNKLEDGLIYFKGYVKGIEQKKVLLFLVD